MKKLLFLLLCISPFLCSCNSGKLEWWEVVNPSERRIEKASGRNDNSKLERYLFEKADQLEAKLSPIRANPKKWGPEDPLFILNAVYFFLMMAVLIFGLVFRFTEPMSRWPYVISGILTSLAAIVSIACFLLIKYFGKHSTEVGPFVMILGYMLSVPYVLEYDSLVADRDLLPDYIKSIYTLLIAIGLIGGSVFRVITTYFSYFMLLLSLIYIVYVIIHALVHRTSILGMLASVIYVVLITGGSIIAMFASIPATTSIISDLIILVIAYLSITGMAVSSRSSSEEPEPEVIDKRNPNYYYSMDNLRDTCKKDLDGDEVFQSDLDDKYFKRSWAGWQEVNKDEIDE